jgi:hypothetical protein
MKLLLLMKLMSNGVYRLRTLSAPQKVAKIKAVLYLIKIIDLILFIFSIIHRMLLCDQMQEDEMGVIFSASMKDDKKL